MKTKTKLKNFAVLGAVLALGAGLAGCSTTKKDTADYAYSGTGERAPAQETAALTKFISTLARNSALGEELAEQKALSYIRTNAEKWGIPSAKTLGQAGSQPELTTQEQETIMKNLKNSTSFSKTVGVKQTDVISAYNASSKSAEVMGSSTIGKGSNLKGFELPTAGVKTGLSSEVDAAITKVDNEEVRNVLLSAAKQHRQIAVDHPELKAVVEDIVMQSAEISAKTGKQVIGASGCTKAVDTEALTNFDETLTAVAKDVKKGEEVGPAFKKELSKVTEEDPGVVCDTRIRPLGNECDIVHRDLVAAACE